MMPGDNPGLWWVMICMAGQHLPQMYRENDLTPLTANFAPQLALCPDCLGFGTTEPAHQMFYPFGPDEVTPCERCGGTGRPALRVAVTRGQGQVEVVSTARPHGFVPPRPGTLPVCLACGKDEADHDGVIGQSVN